MKGAFVLAVAVAAICRPLAAAAQESDAAGRAEPESEERYLDYLNAPHAWFSQRLGNMSRQIDSYFGGADVYEEISGSYLEANLAQQLQEVGSDPATADFHIKVELPYTERHFDLLLESVAEDVDPRNDNPARTRGPRGEGQSSGIFAGLRRVFVDTTGMQISTDLGVKVHLPPELFARARLRRTWPLGDWQLRFKETPFWYQDEGWGQTTEFDLDRWLSERFAFRANSRYQWLNDGDEWLLEHGVALYQILDSRNTLAYETGFQAKNRPLRSTQYRVGLRFRRRVHRDWLFLSVVPDIIWRRDKGFQPEPGLFIELEVLFGEHYLGPHRKDRESGPGPEPEELYRPDIGAAGPR